MKAEDRPVFDKPTGETLIWRYTDFTKFVDLLERRTLFFAAACKLGDPFEGSVPPLNPAGLKEAFRDLPPDFRDDIMQRHSFTRKETTKHTYISC